jgi:hypothetical protein
MRINTAIIFLLFQLIISGCSRSHRPEPIHRFENYRFNRFASIQARVSLPPDMVLQYLRNLDDRPDYSGHLPTGESMHNLEKAICLLPPLNRSALNRRLLGIYFIPGFMGSGLTEWVTDNRGNVYAFMVLNPMVLKSDLSELLTTKENTCFINDDSDCSIRINAGKQYSGLLYILLHESVHLVDYIKNITPYVDNSINKYQRKELGSTPFTRAVWEAYDQPRVKHSFTGRVSFYGIRKPKLRLSESLSIYRELSDTPFASLYGSQSWAEDLAELATFYHITEILKQPYVIQVIKDARILQSIRPMDSPDVRRRFPLLELLYGHEAL